MHPIKKLFSLDEYILKTAFFIFVVNYDFSTIFEIEFKVRDILDDWIIVRLIWQLCDVYTCEVFRLCSTHNWMLRLA